MAIWNFKKEDIDAFLLGMTVYGTGGGGNPETGKTLLKTGFEKGRVFTLIDPEDVPDDAFICSGGIMGSVRHLKNERISEDAESSAKMLVNAIQTLEELKGRKVDYLIPFEVGGSNTPVIMSAAAMLGVPVIDGDGVGRAAPETQMTIWIGKDISLEPMAVADQEGNRVAVLQCTDPTYADQIGREVVVRGGGTAANAHYAMSGKDMKCSSCLHILSRALDLGKLLEDGMRRRENRLEDVKTFLGASTLIRGRVLQEQGMDEGGFYRTVLDIEGTNTYVGHNAKLVLKNETMLIWVDNEIRCIFPDYIFMLDPRTGAGIQTADIQKGMEIDFACAPCDSRMSESLRTEKGKLAFSCARYGYPQLSYVPYCELKS